MSSSYLETIANSHLTTKNYRKNRDLSNNGWVRRWIRSNVLGEWILETGLFTFVSHSAIEGLAFLQQQHRCVVIALAVGSALNDMVLTQPLAY